MEQYIDKYHAVRILIIAKRTPAFELFRSSIEKEWPHAVVNWTEDYGSATALIDRKDMPEWHLVIVELDSVGQSSSAALTHLQALERLRSTPILAVTQALDDKSQSLLLKQGASDFVSKDATTTLFLARLHIQLQYKLRLERLTQKALNMEMFTNGVLHDIRNIETGVLALCELVERRVKRDPFQDKDAILGDITALKRQTHRINDYASAILQKVKSSHLLYSPQAINLVKILDWVKRMISNESDFHIELHQSKSFNKLYCDEAMLKLALLNICQNSYKYRRDNQPCIVHVFQEKDLQPGSMVTTYFEDNGRGIQKQTDLKRIFLPFEKASEGSHTEGFGLGLALVAKVIASMQGEVWAEPSQRYIKNGLRIALRLPVARLKKKATDTGDFLAGHEYSGAI